MAEKKLLVVEVAALGYDLLRDKLGRSWNGLELRPMEGVFPAVTCTVQASFRTAAPPGVHGMVGNGFLSRELRRPMFWEQCSALVAGPRIWEDFRRRGNRVAMLFWQQSLGEDADLVLSPAPIHKHGGGMIEDCYSKPAGLYARLSDAVGRPFKLSQYWGPLASAKSGDWCASATAALLAEGELAPDLCLTYLPTLDFDLQRYGPAHARSRAALDTVLRQLELLLAAARTNGYDMLLFGDYAMGTVKTGAVFPNRALVEAGLMKTRRIRRMLYPDFHESRAFAVVDHEIAHVYVRTPGDVEEVRRCLAGLPGVEQALDRPAQKVRELDHPRSGELVLVAKDGAWFAYPWWRNPREAPDYARHVDIHNKPGYDPCELFFGRLPMHVSTDTAKVKGSHGRTGPERLACRAATCELAAEPKTLVGLASAVRDWLEA